MMIIFQTFSVFQAMLPVEIFLDASRWKWAKKKNLILDFHNATVKIVPCAPKYIQVVTNRKASVKGSIATVRRPGVHQIMSLIGGNNVFGRVRNVF